MRRFIKTVSAAVAAVMAVTMTGALPAGAEEFNNSVVEYSTLEEYVEYAIPHYIRAQSVEIDGTFYYSNAIDIYDINDIEKGSIGECVFLFDDDTIVGKMQVWQVDGEYASVFDTYITEEIQSSFDGGHAIALGYFADDFYSYDEATGSTFVDGLGFEECPDYELPLDEAISKAASMDLAAIPVPYAAGASVDITRVKNQQCDYANADHDHWLCWAACVAMMVNYRDNDSLTAKDVWRAMKTSDNPDPVGNITTIMGAFDEYSYSYNLYSGSISASEAMGALASNEPIYIEISGTDDSNNSAAHAVVICGVSIDNATSTSANITYTFKDPSESRREKTSFIIKANPTEKVSKILYKLSTSDNEYTYTKWRRTIY